MLFVVKTTFILVIDVNGQIEQNHQIEEVIVNVLIVPLLNTLLEMQIRL